MQKVAMSQLNSFRLARGTRCIDNIRYIGRGKWIGWNKPRAGITIRGRQRVENNNSNAIELPRMKPLVV